ncbi:hypothetical protein F5J12DRAFT_848369 [Pisolithus orientalis]|uniref:uncharacterized protein n=1 Tax=Pisolithus orientalis TaxID=936130 RepID=UPI002223F7AF|nr:uncharacterized protein F5J12DRAFT_848369 [Pisolithus orientalis]KAI5998930.1 hypothetical protein F5J12DRAFT_848369 [Pisolithus orientalis]
MAEWPDFITRSFKSAVASDPAGTNESVFYGPYTRLLYNLFSFDGPYELLPQYKIQGDSTNVTIIFVIAFQRRPVFWMEVNPSASFRFSSKRKEADSQMRKRVGDLRANLAIPVLHGVSAFGTRLCFYKYDAHSQELTPHRILAHPTVVTDMLADNWDCDVLETDGMQRLEKVIEEVQEMCARI